MAEQKKDWTGYIVAAVIGVIAIGFQQAERNKADNVGNLPATNANVAANAQAIIDLRDQLTTSINSSEDDSRTALRTEVDGIRNEINRREVETYKYIDTLDHKMEKHVDRIEQRLERDEDLLMDHMLSPPPQHTIDFGDK